MRRTLPGALLALALFGPALAAQDKPKPDQPTPADELKKLQTEVRTAQSEHIKAYQAAKTPEERQKAFRQYRDAAQPFAKRALDLAQKHAKDKAGYDVAFWMLSSGMGGAEADQAAALLLEHHADQVAKMALSLTRSTSPAAEKLLSGLVDKAKEGQAQAQARLHLAQYFKNLVSSDERAGESHPERHLAKAEKIFDEIVQKHADVEAVVKTAKTELFEIRHLSVGKEAPDIEGEDLDAKKFKLSDYRGKVVLLDFWGHW